MKIEELKALEARATPGRWRLDGTDQRVAAGHDICTVHSYLHLRDDCEANRKLIPALRNAAPALLAVVEAAEKAHAEFHHDFGSYATEKAMEAVFNSLTALEQA